MDSPTPPPPKYEPGGDRLMIVVALVVVTALCGMAWSFFSRQSLPRRASVVVPNSSQPAAADSSKQLPRPVPVAPAPPLPARP